MSVATAITPLPSRAAPRAASGHPLRARVAHVLLRYVEISETFIPNTILELDRLGWQGTVVAQQLVNREHFTYPPDQRIVITRRPSLTRRIANRLMLRNIAQRQAHWIGPALAGLSPEIVHAHFGHVATAVAPAIEHRRFPFVVSLHGTDVTAARSEDRWAPGGYELVFSLASCIVVPSRFLASKLAELGYRGRTAIVPAGIRLDRLPFSGPNIGRPGGRVKLLLIARQVPVKGTDVLLRSLPEIRAVHPQAELDVIGHGQELEANARLARELGVGSAVRFLGARSHADALEAIRQADLVVVPSRRAPNGDEESSSLVTREALALGTPVVATNSGGIPESFPPEYRDELVAPDDPAALAARVRAVLAGREQWRDRASTGRRWIETEFDSRRLAERIGEIYEQAIANHREQ